MNIFKTSYLSAFILFVFFAFNAKGQELIPTQGALGIAMEGYPYPYPVEYLASNIQDTPVRMAYMDEKPEKRQWKNGGAFSWKKLLWRLLGHHHGLFIGKWLSGGGS